MVGTELKLGAAQAFQARSQIRARGRWQRVQVVGVVAQEAADGQVVASNELVGVARDWTNGGLPDEDLGFVSSPYAGLFVIADGLDNVGTVRNEITAVGYSTSAPENLIAAVRRYLHVVEIVLTAIGVIALVVAALGIANAMLAAVRERRREIGVLKAIGARDRDVLRVFVVEAAVLGFVGGALGAAGGWVIARVVGGVVNGYLESKVSCASRWCSRCGFSPVPWSDRPCWPRSQELCPPLTARSPAREALGAV